MEIWSLNKITSMSEINGKSRCKFIQANRKSACTWNKDKIVMLNKFITYAKKLFF